jgi:hypothetical protein
MALPVIVRDGKQPWPETQTVIVPEVGGAFIVTSTEVDAVESEIKTPSESL